MKNIPEILLTLDIFHFEISGKYFKDVHFLNNNSNDSILLVSHLEISGNDSNDKHSPNYPLHLVTFDIFHF